MMILLLWMTALSQLKTRKVGKLSWILPEMILCGGSVLHKLLDLMKTVWREGEGIGGML